MVLIQWHILYLNNNVNQTLPRIGRINSGINAQGGFDSLISKVKFIPLILVFMKVMYKAETLPYER